MRWNAAGWSTRTATCAEHPGATDTKFGNIIGPQSEDAAGVRPHHPGGPAGRAFSFRARAARAKSWWRVPSTPTVARRTAVRLWPSVPRRHRPNCSSRRSSAMCACLAGAVYPKKGSLDPCRRRHDLLRRIGDIPLDTQVTPAARDCRTATLHAVGTAEPVQGGCPHHRGDQPGPAAADGREVPRGPLFYRLNMSSRSTDAAAPRPEGRHPDSGATLPAQATARRIRRVRSSSRRKRSICSPELPLARQMCASSRTLSSVLSCSRPAPASASR